MMCWRASCVGRPRSARRQRKCWVSWGGGAAPNSTTPVSSSAPSSAEPASEQRRSSAQGTPKQRPTQAQAAPD
eukprot:8099344-Lingulodinium_polyedra.AAC.1